LIAEVIDLRFDSVKEADLDRLYVFEVAQRDFFESHINARPADFYSRDGVRKAIATAVSGWETGSSYQYLIWGDEEEIVGRVNLHQVRRKHYYSAALGYRVAQQHNGKGIAKQAVQFALNEAFERWHLRRVEASVHSANPASAHILKRHGFRIYGRSLRSFELQGQWFDTEHFEIHAPDVSAS
jgi:[ribosomal protein S5]-alanine N-acetyltransferase